MVFDESRQDVKRPTTMLHIFYRDHRTEVLLFLGAFLLRAFYALFVQVHAGAHGFIAFSDAESFFYNGALNLLNHGVFSAATEPPYYPNGFHTPLYQMFLAALLYAKLPLFAIALVQAGLSAAIVVFAYKIGAALADRQIAIWAAILVALEPMFVYWGGLLMSDVLFGFLMMLSFWMLLRDRYEFAALFLGLATLARPIALLFIPVFVLFVAFQTYRRDKKSGAALLSAALVIVIAAAVISPWYVRNKITFNTWELSSGGWYDLYAYPVSIFASQSGIPIANVAPDSPGDGKFTRFGFEYTAQYKQAALEVIAQDTPGYLFFQIHRSLSSLFTDRYEYLIHTMLYAQARSLYEAVPSALWEAVLAAGRVFWLLVYALGLVALTDRKLLPWGLFFLAMVGINAGISGGINPGGTEMSRYSIPFLGFFFVFAAYGLRKIWRLSI
jgi:4-amino-4-deoxy-L-arabinose transferase-like glycosyltransferase